MPNRPEPKPGEWLRKFLNLTTVDTNDNQTQTNQVFARQTQQI